MDKYKTSEMGKALKKVFHGEITVDDSVKMAEREISDIFKAGGSAPLPSPVNTGKLGEIAGKCPLCGKNVIRGNKSYGCIGYKDGCEFRLNLTICKKTIPINEVARLLATGETAKMRGFISKNGKSFDGKLALQDGKAVFKF
jgi:DNA topoisomerase-3